MRFKKSVRVRGASTEILLAVMAADVVWRNHGQRLVVTSLTDGDHSEGSRHHCGDGVDLRTRYFADQEEIERVAQELRESLTDDYDVVVEATHIHVEYDPRRY